MSGEEYALPVELEKLEIVSGKASVAAVDENPFRRRGASCGARSSASLWSARCPCTCSHNKRSLRSKVTFKKTYGKVLKEPVLKYVNTCCQGGSKSEDITSSMSTVALSSIPVKLNATIQNDVNTDNGQFGNAAPPVQHDFRSLVSGCSQLRISNEREVFSSESFLNLQQRSEEVPETVEWSLQASGGNSGGDYARGTPSCSQQVLNPPCDVTIDELASYFETLVHIPKKMSTMAEMMYI